MATTVYSGDTVVDVFAVSDATGSTVTGYADSLTITVYSPAHSLWYTPAVTETLTTGDYHYSFNATTTGMWYARVVDDSGFYPDALRNFYAIGSASTSSIDTLKEWHWDVMDKFESVLDNTESYAATNYDEHIDTQSRIDTNQSMLRTVESYTNIVESQLDTNQSMLHTVESYTNIVESQLDTNQSMLHTIQAFTNIAESQLDTTEDYLWELDSKVRTCQSFLMWDMDGLGTGKYYYDQDGYYRNTELSGTEIPWSTGDVGALYYGGNPLEDVLVTVFIVTNGVRTRNVADQTYTDENGNYHGYLDPGSYSFHFHKRGYIDEYHDRTLVEA